MEELCQRWESAMEVEFEALEALGVVQSLVVVLGVEQSLVEGLAVGLVVARVVVPWVLLQEWPRWPLQQ